MRDLEQCKAEVFRRSEMRIAAAKRRRNHILTACVPAVLCIAVLGTIWLPGARRKDGSPGLTEEMYGSHFVALTCPAAEIRVAGSGVYRSFREAQEVSRIFGRISDCTAERVGSFGVAPWPDDTGEKTTGAEKYTVTLFLREGGSMEYLLTGNSLTDLAAGEVYFLTDRQAEDLMELLQIPGR